jgi:MFS family permease
MGLTCGGLIGAVPRLAMDNEPCNCSAATGMLFASFSLGGFLGPYIGGALGGKTAAWMVLAGLAAAGFVVLILHYLWIARRFISCYCAEALAMARQKTGFSVVQRAYQRTFGRRLARRVHGDSASSPLRSHQNRPELDKEGHPASKTEDSPEPTEK